MPKLKPIDPLAPAKADPDSVTEIVLNPAHMRNTGFEWAAVPEFPREILACRNLKKLDLFRCFRGKDYTIPDDLDRLSSLEELSIGGLMIEKLPDAIGRLPKLRELSLEYNELLSELPASIGGLTALEELELAYTGITSLPASIGKLTRLKRLGLSGKESVVPPELFDLTNLESLDLGGVATLPPGLGRLTKLEGLSIDATALASAASELPNLRRLKRLTVGEKGAPIPAEVFGLEALEVLNMCAIGLETLPSLAALTHLEELDVASNALTSLAAEIAVLPALKELSYSDNPLPLAEKRLVEALMKLPPSERPAAVAAAKEAKAKPAKAAPKAKAKKRETPTRLGAVAAPNAILSLLIAGADVASHFKGTEGDDYDRARAGLDDAEAPELELGAGSGLALELGVDQGIASVWELKDGRLVIVEAIFEKDEKSLGGDDRALFHEMITEPPSKEARKLGVVKIRDDSCWALVIAPIQEDLSNVADLLKKKSSKPARPCGGEEEALLVSVDAHEWTVLLEPPVEGSWGRGRRCLLLPS